MNFNFKQILLMDTLNNIWIDFLSKGNTFWLLVKIFGETWPVRSGLLRGIEILVIFMNIYEISQAENSNIPPIEWWQSMDMDHPDDITTLFTVNYLKELLWSIALQEFWIFPGSLRLSEHKLTQFLLSRLQMRTSKMLFSIRTLIKRHGQMALTLSFFKNIGSLYVLIFVKPSKVFSLMEFYWNNLIIW